MMKNTHVLVRRKNKLSKWFEPITIILFILLFAYSVSLILPFIWAINTSFKTWLDYYFHPFNFPSKDSLKIFYENYVTAANNFTIKINNKPVYIEEQILNSILYAIGGAFFITVTNCTVAYCCAKFPQIKASSVYVTIVIVAMSIPIIGSKPSELQMLINLKLYDTILGSWVLKMNFMGIYFLVFYTSFKAIPKDYSDAAVVDGANNFDIYLRMMLPFVGKTFGTVFLIYFIQFWNDYQVPLLYMPSHPTLSYGLYKFSVSTGTAVSGSVPVKMAGCMLLFLPIFIIFIIFQKKLLGNIMTGGIKE